VSTYTATLRSVDSGVDVLIGTSDGKSEPQYETVSSWDSSGFVGVLDDAYEEGLHHTGSVGEVRDMLFSMHRLANRLDDFELMVPDATLEKAAAEEAAELKAMPPGAQF
jgi:hypothetical protein